MSVRMVDYYVKHLPFDSRQEIFAALEKINPLSVEKNVGKRKRLSKVSKCWLFG